MVQPIIVVRVVAARVGALAGMVLSCNKKICSTRIDSLKNAYGGDENLVAVPLYNFA